MEKIFHYAPTGNRMGHNDMNRTWDFLIPAFRNAPHVWNVGCQDNVACFLIDTGDGLVLIDTGFVETAWMLIDGIWATGHNPRDIKKIFLTHWHCDHVEGVPFIQKLSGCEVWLSKEDEAQHQQHNGERVAGTVPYTVTNFYDDNTPIKMGNFTFVTKTCTGHSAGATSFFFEDTDEETGKTYKVALHGGLGVGAMDPSNLAKMASEGLYPENAYKFIADCLEMAEWPVDIALASHYNQGNIVPNIPADTNDYSVFVADYAWGDVLRNRAYATMAYYPEKYPEIPEI